jgi:chromosome segregation protein
VSAALFDDPSGVKAASAAAEVRGELRSIRTAVERSDSDLRRSSERTDVLRQRVAALDAETERLRAHCADAEVVETPLVAEVERAERRRRSAEAHLESVTEARQRAAEDASRWSARVEALQQALDVARARAGAERLANVDGVLGTLLDLIEIDDGWQPAVEAALGEALTAVVVDGPESARRALSVLRGSETSGAVLAVGVGASDATTPQVGAPVRPHAHSDRPGLATLLDALIGNAVRVADANAAIDVAIAHPDAIVVTEAGDRFGAGCWRIGAAAGGTTATALDRARDDSVAANDRLAVAEQAVRDATEQLAATRATESDLAMRLDSNDARFTAAAEALARVQGERRELNAELESLARAMVELTDHIASERARIAELDAVLPALTADEQAEAHAASARGRVRAELEARTAVLGSRRRDLEVRNAGLHERQQLLERRISETELRLEADAGARTEAESRRMTIERSLGAVDRLSAVVTARRDVIEVEHARLADQRRRQSEEVRSLAGRLEGHRRERADAERQLEQVREKAHRLDIEEAEAKLRLETAIETLRRDLEIEPEVAEKAEAPPVPEGSTPAGRARELERELRMLGPINPLALEEFTELLQRHTFLEDQLEDVRSTRRDLGRIIKAVDQEIQSVFAGAYADVSANFTELFATLFPGGVGTLPLTDPDDLLATGIEIEAKPSGKNVKKLSLLSGGERSLTALAFLFAVFRSRPSPFYVMDEVEAALDDINLHRFLGLVAEFRKDAQLLIVSHQKRTMEAGDSLLGVSMQPGGSSKVITERVSTPV